MTNIMDRSPQNTQLGSMMGPSPRSFNQNDGRMMQSRTGLTPLNMHTSPMNRFLSYSNVPRQESQKSLLPGNNSVKNMIAQPQPVNIGFGDLCELQMT